jgi:CheY-like chemotaxis protein
VIDDDPRVGELLSAALEPAGFEVSVATNAADGLALAGDSPPSAIVLDLLMPEMSGYDVLTALRAQPGTRNVPIVILTAANLSDAQREELRREATALADKGDLSQRALVALLERITRRASASNGGGPVVLVVDDNDMNRALARSLLERSGYRVAEAHSGDAAVSAARHELPALVLMDLAMPGKNGYEAFAELRSDPSTAHIPVVALTAMAMRADEAKVKAAGFDAYLTKPVQPALFEATLNQLLPKTNSTKVT